MEEYHYNANGSRIYEMNALRGISGRNLAYSDEDHLLTAGNVTYTYDLDGFLLSKTDGAEVTSFDYSSQGELFSVGLPLGDFIEYVHDPLGRRIAKKVNGATVEKYLWQGLTRLLAVYDGANNLTMRFEYADSRMPYAMTKSGVVYYLSYDQVGSLQIVADGSGNVVKRIDYDSFGNIIDDTNAAFEIPFGFAGGLHDRDTGLVRFGYRDYDPETGRWTAKDPIGFAGGDTDLYGYCLNNPIMFIDPYGLAWSDILPGIGTAISQGVQGGAYAVGQAAHDTANLAANGPPLAQAALCLAALSEVAPLAGAAAASDTAAVAVYQLAPYSDAFVDYVSSALPATPPSPNWAGLLGWLTGEAYNDLMNNSSSNPCK